MSDLGNRLTKAQAVLEYAIILAIVSAALLGMSLYMRRAVQGGLNNIEQRMVGKQNGTIDVSSIGCGGPGQPACP